LLAEAIHSFVDSVDQILLLIGESRGRRPPDADHPLGHGMESYFWSFIVAVMVLLLGGGASFYQGVHRILSPETVLSPFISVTVLAAGRLRSAHRYCHRALGAQRALTAE
jgi:divalent metal cation (Fe/Co/Zn/Cd) transporter